MKSLVSLLCGLLAVIGLGGCKPYGLAQIQPGVTTDAEVRQWLGEPGMEWRNEDGSVTLEYSGQPAGTQCHMITVGPDRIVRSVEQVLNERNFARIKAGMVREEVQRIIGRPANTQFFALSQERVYNWNVDGGPTITDPVFFTVHFDTSGHVTRTSMNVQYRR
jgi:outer membrane protein assembly factor BamE (lipoprotein component of BamABCDE complex)